MLSYDAWAIDFWMKLSIFPHFNISTKNHIIDILIVLWMVCQYIYTFDIANSASNVYIQGGVEGQEKDWCTLFSFQ